MSLADPTDHVIHAKILANQIVYNAPLFKEELEQVNESAFARLMASSIDESRPGGKASIQAPDLTGQNATRHQVVLMFPYCQKTQSLALQVARCFNRGRWFAYELELSWKKTGRFQPENKGGETMAHRGSRAKGYCKIVDDFEVAVPETSASVTETSIRGFYKLALYVPSMLILQ
ncbi:hypothetical protein V8E54_013201 [Elaphomyces granulatus]